MVALSALVTEGDLVLFDRNNHKAALHGALMINGGVPVYVPTSRNAWRSRSSICALERVTFSAKANMAYWRGGRPAERQFIAILSPS